MSTEYWLIGSITGEYVMFYNPTGSVMHFTTDRDEAKHVDERDLDEVLRVANTIYKRNFRRFYVAD